jgi:hypothetical protein
MPEETENPELRAFCVDQVQRLSQFKEFQFMSTSAQKDYRKFLERKLRTRERIAAVMDAAVELPNMPSIAALNQIYIEMFVPYREPELSDEERQARAEYLRDWYAQEAREAAARRERAKTTAVRKPGAVARGCQCPN